MSSAIRLTVSLAAGSSDTQHRAVGSLGPDAHMYSLDEPFKPTQEEKEITRTILKHTDRESLAVLTADAARAIPPLVHLSQPTVVTLWKLVDTEDAGFLNTNQVAQLVRLIGYAQTAERNLSRTLLRKPGPTCRIDGWTVPPGTNFEKPCSEEEEILVKAILRENDPEGLGIIEGSKSKPLLRRSGLPNETLARIWEIVDQSKRGFLVADDIKRVLRLVSCAQRDLPLHSRQYENRTSASPSPSKSV